MPVLPQKPIYLAAALIERVDDAEAVQRIKRKQVEDAERKAVGKDQREKIDEKGIGIGWQDGIEIVKYCQIDRIDEKCCQIIHDNARTGGECHAGAVFFEIIRVDGNGFRPAEADERKADEADQVEVL